MHIVAGAAIGGLIGGGIEAVRQYRAEGKVTDWGKVGGAATGGAISGAITAAFPGGGLIGVATSSGVASGAGGIVERGIASGGKDFRRGWLVAFLMPRCCSTGGRDLEPEKLLLSHFSRNRCRGRPTTASEHRNLFGSLD